MIRFMNLYKKCLFSEALELFSGSIHYRVNQIRQLILFHLVGIISQDIIVPNYSTIVLHVEKKEKP